MRPPDWWPDWNGKCAAIIASGPSVTKDDIALLKDRIKIIAIKKNVELCPFADVVYGCDAPWWKSVRGLPDFKGLKIAWAKEVGDLFPDVHRIEIAKVGSDKYVDKLLTDTPGVIGAGGNSGFQALNLVVQFAAKRILLIGFDMHGRSGDHWYGRNNWWGSNNPSEDNYRRWQAAFNAAAPVLDALGIEMINASPISALRCFTRRSVEQTLVAWGL